MVKRNFPNPIALAKLMKFKAPQLDATKRRLSSALTIHDLRTIAKRRTPKAAFDYTDGAAEGELSLARARQAFEDIEFHPSILRDVSTVDTSTTILGGSSAMPFGIAPTGFTRLMQTEGEIAGASAAAAAGIPFTLSTLGTTSIEAVKAANPEGRNWFQLYVMRDREISYGLVERAAGPGEPLPADRQGTRPAGPPRSHRRVVRAQGGRVRRRPVRDHGRDACRAGPRVVVPPALHLHRLRRHRRLHAPGDARAGVRWAS